ncbi:hypothetical protein KCU95_g41, partial [Aureobasidium melanogenum]
MSRMSSETSPSQRPQSSSNRPHAKRARVYSQSPCNSALPFSEGIKDSYTHYQKRRLGLAFLQVVRRVMGGTSARKTLLEMEDVAAPGPKSLQRLSMYSLHDDVVLLVLFVTEESKNLGDSDGRPESRTSPRSGGRHRLLRIRQSRGKGVQRRTLRGGTACSCRRLLREASHRIVPRQRMTSCKLGAGSRTGNCIRPIKYERVLRKTNVQDAMSYRVPSWHIGGARLDVRQCGMPLISIRHNGYRRDNQSNGPVLEASLQDTT